MTALIHLGINCVYVSLACHPFPSFSFCCSSSLFSFLFFHHHRFAFRCCTKTSKCVPSEQKFQHQIGKLILVVAVVAMVVVRVAYSLSEFFLYLVNDAPIDIRTHPFVIVVVCTSN